MVYDKEYGRVGLVRKTFGPTPGIEQPEYDTLVLDIRLLKLFGRQHHAVDLTFRIIIHHIHAQLLVTLAHGAQQRIGIMLPCLRRGRHYHGKRESCGKNRKRHYKFRIHILNRYSIPHPRRGKTKICKKCFASNCVSKYNHDTHPAIIIYMAPRTS